MADDREETEQRIGGLVEAALQGDAEAVSLLYRFYEAKMIRVAHRRLGHTLHGLMESVDLVQSVWKDALENLDRFEYRGPDSFYRWLHTCLVNKIEGKRRRHRAGKRDARRQVPLDDHRPGFRPSPPAQGDPTPSRVAMELEEEERFLRVLERFPEEQRRVLILRMRDELEFSAIARVTGKSVEAVKKLFQRGLKKLIDRLPEEWRDPGG